MITDVLFANGLTLGFLYACWRLNRRGPDWVGVGIAAWCLAAAAIIVLAERQEAPQADRYSTAAQQSVQN